MSTNMVKICLIVQMFALSSWSVDGVGVKYRGLRASSPSAQTDGACEEFCEGAATGGGLGLKIGKQNPGELGTDNHWEDVCKDPGMTDYCGGCKECKEFCPESWQKNDNKCYKLQPTRSDYDNAKKWCTDQGADLVSIHSANENQFVRDNVCGAESCWLGLTEKVGTGDKGTKPADQKWGWADGSDLGSYTNWKLWGGPNDEPNNWGGGPNKYDERYTFMNFPHNGNVGKWYDAPKMHQAKAICEVRTGAAVQTPPPSPCPMGWTDFKNSCYIASPTQACWEGSRQWCQGNGADLVSIKDEEENTVVRTVCGARICWLGLSEKPGTGTMATSPAQQQWVWNDGTDMVYSKWKLWGGKYNEPNNWGHGGPNKHDERKGFINWPNAGYAGSWYDGPAGMNGFAVCEKSQNA